MAPTGTPADVIDKLGRELNNALKSPELIAILEAQGFESLGGTPQDFSRYIESEVRKWSAAALIAGVRK